MKRWIVVADGSQARIYSTRDRNPKLKLVRQLTHPESREQGLDLLPNRPDRIQHNGEMTARGGMDPSSVHHEEQRKFARILAEALDASCSGHEFDELVLVAAPKFLGYLRTSLSAQVGRRVIQELPKDLVNAAPPEVADIVLT